jgi:hypothetical protein
MRETMSRRTRYSVVSCHVERLLDDAVFARYRAFVARRPGGHAVASLVRPPDPDAGEDAAVWAGRVRELAALGPLGHHTHWGGPTQARPRGQVDAGDRVREEAAAFREAGVEPRFFCGGGWYIDTGVAAAAADLGYVDCTATAYPLPYLAPEAPRAELEAPAWLRLGDGRRLLELPATRSAGMLLRSGGRLPEPLVHVHFHDWDLLDPRRRLALEAGLRLLALLRTPATLEEAAAAAQAAPERDFAAASKP